MNKNMVSIFAMIISILCLILTGLMFLINKNTLKQYKHFYITTNRPIIMLDFEQTKIKFDGQSLVLDLVIKNLGNIPAYDVSSFIWITNEENLVKETKIDTPGIPIAPGQTKYKYYKKSDESDFEDNYIYSTILYTSSQNNSNKELSPYYLIMTCIEIHRPFLKVGIIEPIGSREFILDNFYHGETYIFYFHPPFGYELKREKE